MTAVRGRRRPGLLSRTRPEADRRPGRPATEEFTMPEAVPPATTVAHRTTAQDKIDFFGADAQATK
ncbi:hypothetical protein [Amycolatopsis sp. PS_44_ISF1]|uniref:hypothetical protein n=1 Tax=Amycolatopsis sp. PS_44_ISF1 TaxID=2974917 RepID=UPI0028DE88E3|nr:hypothetical protein [Amycolatopsis sp. PS_44_ISF1]MDT8910064.1 hypothetical protein [Amycolatopsis sp. PS_44_ISF1]